MPSQSEHHITLPILRGLYVITPSDIEASPLWVRLLTLCLSQGVAAIQLRMKDDRSGKEKLDLANKLKDLCHLTSTKFIINDDVELAKACNADGVHLGVNDMPIQEARQLLGNKAIIGATCHNSLCRGRASIAASANYLAFGRFFPSKTKPHAPLASMNTLVAAKKEFNVPIVAIGGITLENSEVLLSAGADMLAVVGGLFDQADIVAAVRRFTQKFI